MSCYSARQAVNYGSQSSPGRFDGTLSLAATYDKMLMRAATVVQVLQDFEALPTIAPRPPTTVANPHIDRSLGSKKTHIQSHNRRRKEVDVNSAK